MTYIKALGNISSLRVTLHRRFSFAPLPLTPENAVSPIGEKFLTDKLINFDCVCRTDRASPSLLNSATGKNAKTIYL